ncbi:Hpt domain-containing protein [Elongatibacter sediminis]|uniref:Chemotaxis protein CheA n=1 Tax=Elongatibacter sediminis TaxID=3119006 RepID=A0AAW9RE02_9GAMM
MMLEGTNASSAIRWVRQDLDEAMQSIRDNLESYAEDETDRSALREVQERLEQLNLTFLTMEQKGASILTDEMIAVGGHLLHDGGNRQESLAALTDAVVVLPSYLDRLQAGHDDLPILLLPTLNELRATYDEKLLSEGTLFAPVLDVMIPELNGNEADAIGDREFSAFARRVRNQYQAALLGWLKEQSKSELLDPLQEVCRTLHRRLGRLPLRRMWWIAEMTIAGFRDHAIDNDLPLRRLFARLDLNLKSLAEIGEDGPPDDALVALSRALLFHAAQARPGSKSTDLLRQRFQLEELIPDRDALMRARGAVTGRDAELFRSIGDAVREEMAAVKDTLDMELRTGRVETEQRESSLASLRQLADTLNMLNLPVPARAVEDLLPSLEEMDGADNTELDSPLLRLARKLIEVESLLDTHIRLLGEPVDEEQGSDYIELPAREYREILGQMLDQCVSSLHDAQDAVHKRLAGDAEADFGAPLEAVAGALKMAGQREVGMLTEKLGRTLNAGLHAKAEGASDEEARLIPLTDAVAALDLYLSGCRDEQANSLRFLEIMHERLDGLPEADTDGADAGHTKIELPERAAAAPEPQPVAADADGAQPVLDPDLQAVFMEEFDGVLAQLAERMPVWMGDLADRDALNDVRRGFHTLKGSGRMVGAVEVGDFAWRVEDLLNHILEGKTTAGPDMADAVQLAVSCLPELKARLLQEPSALDAGTIAAVSDFYRRAAAGEAIEAGVLRDMLPAALVAGAEPAGTARTTAESGTTGTGEAASQPETGAADGVDPELAQLMIGEIRQYIGDLDGFANGTDDQAAGEVSEELIRAAHTLASTLALAPLGQESELARAIEHYLIALGRKDLTASRDALTVVQHCLHRFRQRLYILENGNATTYPLEDAVLLASLTAETETAQQATAAQEPAAATAEPVEEAGDVAAGEAQADAATSDSPDPSSVLNDESGIIAIFLEEAVEVLERCDTLLNTWRDKLSDRKLVQNLQREIHTFKGGARMAGLDPLGDLAHAMETLMERIAANRLQATVAAVQALEEGCDRLNVWVEQLLTGQMPAAGNALARFEQRTAALELPGSEAAATEIETAAPVAAPAEAEVPEADTTGQTAEPAPDTVGADETARESTAPEAGDDGDTAARAAAATAADSGDETTAASVPGEETEADQPAAAETRTEEQTSVTPAAADAPDRKAGDDTGPREAAPREPAQAPPAPAAEPPKREFRDIPDRPAVEAADDAASQQHIRVAAELMDSLVNHAGEISIYRARLEQQLGSVRFNLKEMDQTVGRLKDQLRKMDMEAEAQMLSRYQHASSQSSSDFDPLELDRFSNMQQLSRALTESVSDLLNLQEMMGESVRQAETLLVQQSRVSSDLQEGLMQTRMTPFGSAAPRLRRVVRAAAAETGKRARLQLRMAGSSDQLDRNVLERITAPLEHMLRNAVVHGIEAPKVRRQKDKPEEGEIVVTVEAEATEFIVRVEDDGNGVNLDAVRKRAIERGLLGKADDVSAARLTSFILESGFSTAETVTGLAGRGVGMDVVNSEIRQIGGSMDIDSEAGKGTRFTIRIPFSLAVMQAIGVTVGERPYLVPLNSVGGVARMVPADYAALCADGNPEYEFAGEKYPVLELEPLLGEEAPGKTSGNVSLLMIRAGEHKAAFRVTELQSHQEVVMKPVGPQISSIPGILGATISADGQVVIILDMGPVIRRGLALAANSEKPVEPPKKEKLRKPLVMVVDDSITMRKVTSRVLENHALDVMTAQDGLDAIENLHERIPDLMLLDIEMPRMDGYELAEHVRSDPRLRHVPIVMITSRAGQKHRRRARQAGANEYMTKPYQEADLVAKVGEMLKLDLNEQRTD